LRVITQKRKKRDRRKGENRRFVYYDRSVGCLSSVVALHTENLYHTNKDVDEVKFEANTLVDWVSADYTALSKTSAVQDFLDVIESEAAKDSKTSIEPDTLRPHQRTSGSGWENERSKTGNSDNGNTCKKGTAEVEVLLLLGSGTDKSDRTHHTNGVEAGTGEQSG
jgi:hypothetical protein